MKQRIAAVLILSSISVLALLAISLGGCASLQTPGNATTQFAGEVQSGAETAAPVVAATVPAPFGEIAAGALGIVAVLAGIIAHASTTRANTQNVLGAVAAGATAASASLTPGVAGAINAADAGVAAADEVLASSPAAPPPPPPPAPPQTTTPTTAAAAASPATGV